MKPRIEFVVPGHAVASQRVNKVPIIKPGGKLGIRGFTPPESREFMERVALHARAAFQRHPNWAELSAGVGAIFRVHLHFVRNRQQGDADNMAKGVLDGIKKANRYRPDPTKRDRFGRPRQIFVDGIFRDDARVTQLLISITTDPRAEERTEVVIETASMVLHEPLWLRCALEAGMAFPRRESERPQPEPTLPTLGDAIER